MYHAPHEEYKKFLEARDGKDKEDDKVCNPLLSSLVVITPGLQAIVCRGFRAGQAHRQAKWHGKPCSGILSISCARHGCFLANGTVDLNKGERYEILAMVDHLES